jgi:hypothetical protein
MFFRGKPTRAQITSNFGGELRDKLLALHHREHGEGAVQRRARECKEWNRRYFSLATLGALLAAAIVTGMVKYVAGDIVPPAFYGAMVVILWGINIAITISIFAPRN